MIYTEHLTRMSAAQVRLSQSMRDKKPIEARKHLADIKECAAALDAFLNPEVTLPPSALRKILNFVRRT